MTEWVNLSEFPGNHSKKRKDWALEVSLIKCSAALLSINEFLKEFIT